MSQLLYVSGRTDPVLVDRTFEGVAERPRMMLIDGQVVQMGDGRSAPPRVAEQGGRYFFLDAHLTPVRDPKHVEHLPEPFKAEALAFIERVLAGEVMVHPTVTVEQESVARLSAGAVENPVRELAALAFGLKPVAAGGPAAAPSAARTVVIADEASLLKMSGGVTVEQVQDIFEQT